MTTDVVLFDVPFLFSEQLANGEVRFEYRERTEIRVWSDVLREFVLISVVGGK